MDVRVGQWRKLSTEELMFLNCGVGEDSRESLGLQGDPTSPSQGKSVLNIHWKNWCLSWSSNTLATWFKELTHLKRPWCWKRLKVGRERDDRRWDGWMVSLTQWTWLWKNSRSCLWTGRPGVLQSMGLQRVGHAWATELNWTGLSFQVDLVLKNLLPMQETFGFNPWVGKICWRRAWQPTPVFLSGESPGQRSLAGYSPWACKELPITEGSNLTQQTESTFQCREHKFDPWSGN